MKLVADVPDPVQRGGAEGNKIPPITADSALPVEPCRNMDPTREQMPIDLAIS